MLIAFKIYWSLGMLLLLFGSLAPDFKRQQVENCETVFGGDARIATFIMTIAAMVFALIWPIAFFATPSKRLVDYINKISGRKK